MAQLIQKTDPLNVGREKLNEAIEIMNKLTPNFYPFQPNINNSIAKYKDVREAISDVKLYGVDITKKYGIGFIMRNRSHPNYGTDPQKWIISIWELTETSRVVEVANFTVTNYSEPAGVITVSLAAVNNSGITGTVSIDWSKVNANYIYIDSYYNDTGFDKSTYADFIIPETKQTLSKDFLFPFHTNATLRRDVTKPQLKRLFNSIKDVKIYGAKAGEKFYIDRFYYKFSSPAWSLITIDKEDGERVCEAYFRESEGYVYPNGVTKVTLAEVSGSGITADVWINWNELAVGDSYTSSTPVYDITGLDYRSISKDNPVPSINLPSTLYAVVGKEFNIYWENVFVAPAGRTIDDYVLRYDINMGLAQDNRYYVTPTSGQVGNHTLTLRIFEINTEKLVRQLTYTVKVIANTVGNAVNKKCLFIGDSLTGYGTYTQHILDNFDTDVMDVTLLGTLGTAPNKHEGRPGWTTAQYLSEANPFLKGGNFDFANYMSVQGYTGLNYVVILLGTNDVKVVSNAYDLDLHTTNAVNRIETMVNSIKTYDANVKVIVSLPIPPGKDHYAFSKLINGTHLTPEIQNFGNRMLSKKLMDKFTGKEAQGIYAMPLNMCLDSYNHFPTEQVQISARNTNTVEMQNDCYHPIDAGWWQMADTAFAYLKSFEV